MFPYSTIRKFQFSLSVGAWPIYLYTQAKPCYDVVRNVVGAA